MTLRSFLAEMPLIHLTTSSAEPPRQSGESRAGGARPLAFGSAQLLGRLVWKYLRMSAGVQVPLSERAGLVAEIFAILADPTRVRVILALQDGELSVGSLASVVEKNPTAVSQHLAKLRLARVVSARQDGNRVFYRLTDEHAARLVNEALLQAEHSAGGVPAHHVDGGR